MLQRIKSALQMGKIKSLHGGTGMEAEVARTEFIKLAKLYNERPRFLFPDR
jgi:hypothetical protein